jgi:chaperonin cofactor prefoldin
MAQSGERRMLFDTRGKRKHVIRVVYAILALLMGASLFLVVGPFNLGNLIGNSSSSSSAAKVLHEQAERIEGRLARSPNDEQLLLALTRARVNAGNAQLERTSETAPPVVTPEAKKDFEAASEAWTRYLKQSAEPNTTAAQLLGSTYFQLAESSATVGEAVEYVAKGTAAQKIAAQQSPSLGSLSTLAIYEYFAGNFAGGEKATKQVVAMVKGTSKTEAKSVEKQLAEYRKRGKAFAKQKKEVAKFEREKGKESLENPFSGFGGGAGG